VELLRIAESLEFKFFKYAGNKILIHMEVTTRRHCIQGLLIIGSAGLKINNHDCLFKIPEACRLLTGQDFRGIAVILRTAWIKVVRVERTWNRGWSGWIFN